MNLFEKDASELNLTGIDLFKLFAAVLVVMSHTGILTSYSYELNFYFVNVAFRWCVPFFFLASGYFMPGDSKNLCKYCFRILLLELLWSALYYIAPGYNMELNLELLKRFFQIGGAIDPFWYFSSLIVSVLLVYILKKIFRQKYAVIFAIVSVLYIFALMGDTYSNCFADNQFYLLHYAIWNGSTRNGFFFGSLYVFIGDFLRQNKKAEEWIQDVKCSSLVVCIIVSFFYLWFEILVYKKLHTGVDCNVLASAVPLATGIFLLSLKLRVNTSLSVFFRRMSTLLFVSHYYFVIVIAWDRNSILRFLGILGITSLLSVIIIKASGKIRLLRYLY